MPGPCVLPQKGSPDSSYTAADCVLRLFSLQDICCSSGFEALLVIAGTDGRDNLWAKRLLSFLLRGLSGQEAMDSPALPSSWEDAVLLVRQDRVALFCGSEAYKSILPLIMRWPAMTVYCTAAEEENDTDRAEDYKVRSFLSMLEGLEGRRIGIALESEQTGDVGMEVEQWPLVQAYAVEGIGMGGFFTMHHTIVDIASQLAALFSRLDGHALASNLRTRVPSLAQQWSELMALLDSKSPAERLRLTEAEMAEPLLTYCDYGLLRSVGKANQRSERHLGLTPQVTLSGRRVSEREDESFTVANGGRPRTAQALHFVVEGCGPHSGLHCARTYFLANRKLAQARGIDMLDELGPPTPDEVDGESTDVALLQRLYCGLVGATRAAMAAFAAGPAREAGAEIMLKVARAHLSQVVTTWYPDGSTTSTPPGAAAALAALSSLTLDLWAYDPIKCDTEPASWGDHRLKVVRASLSSVASLKEPSTTLGSLVFSETFTEVGGGLGGDVAGHEKETTVEEAPSLIVLTEAIPAFAAWAGVGDEEEELAACNDSLQLTLQYFAALGDGPTSWQRHLAATTMPPRSPLAAPASGTRVAPLGAPLAETGEAAYLAVGGLHQSAETCLPLLPGSFIPFETGVVFVSSRWGPLSLKFGKQGDVTRVSILRDGHSHAPRVLLFECSSNAVPAYGPLRSFLSSPVVPTGRPSLIVALDLRSLPPASSKLFGREVLPVWEATWASFGITHGFGVTIPVPKAMEDVPAEGTVSTLEWGYGKELLGPDFGYLGSRTFLLHTDDGRVAQAIQKVKLADAWSWRKRGESPEPGSCGNSKTGSCQTSEPEGWQSSKPGGWQSSEDTSDTYPGQGVPLVVVSGTTGSGTHLFSQQLVQANGVAGRSSQWGIVLTGLESNPVALDVELLRQDLDRALALLQRPLTDAPALDQGAVFEPGTGAEGSSGKSAGGSSPGDGTGGREARGGVISPLDPSKSPSGRHISPAGVGISAAGGHISPGPAKQSRRSSVGGGTNQAGVVLLCPGLVPVQEVVQTVRRLPATDEGRMRVQVVVACVSAQLFFSDAQRGRTAPGVLEQVTAGVVDTIMLFDGASVPSEQLDVIRTILQAANPTARVIEVARGSHIDDLEEAILPLEWQELRASGKAEEQELARVLAWRPIPGVNGRTPISSMATSYLDTVRLRCLGQLDTDVLQWELAAAFAGTSVTEPRSPRSVPAQPPPVDPVSETVIAVQGHVRDEAGQVVRVLATTAAVQIEGPAPDRTDPCHPLSIDEARVGADGCHGPAADLVFVGVAPLNHASLRAILTRSRPKVPRLVKERDAASFTDVERLRLNQTYKDSEPLPSGWYYDGRDYIDVWGQRSQFHPSMRKWVERYLEELNEGVRQTNQELEREREGFGTLRFIE